MSRPIKAAVCHPERRHYGNSLCASCYQMKRRRDKGIKQKTLDPLQRHRYQVRRFGLTVDQYALMLLAQNNVCAICGHGPKTRRLGVDHDHKTGRVRALLCHTCNKLRMGMNTLDTARRVLALLSSNFDGRNT